MSNRSLNEQLVSSSIIYEGKLFNLRKDRVKLPNGQLTDRHIVEHPGAVAILPILNDQILLIRQFRQAAGKVLFELPAGTLMKNELPDHCAARELEEETGYRAGHLKKLSHYYLAPGYSTEIIYLYLATSLQQTRPNTDPDEFIEIQKISLQKALQMVSSNEIEDAKTICGILLLQQLNGTLGSSKNLEK